MIFQNFTSFWKNIEIASELGMECILKKNLKMEVSKVLMTSLDLEGCKLQSEQSGHYVVQTYIKKAP